MKTRRFLPLLVFALLSIAAAKGQNVGLKTNLLPDAALSPNLGVEFRLAPKWSMDLTGQMNLWPINDHKWKHWLVQPEARYWFCEPFIKSFLGIHAIGGGYNVGNIGTDINFLGTDFGKLRDARYEGWAVGGGIAYGYARPVGKHWNFEFEIGIGYVYTRYKKFNCTECSHKIGEGHHNYYGPTKAAINLVYIF